MSSFCLFAKSLMSSHFCPSIEFVLFHWARVVEESEMVEQEETLASVPFIVGVDLQEEHDGIRVDDGQRDTGPMAVQCIRSQRIRGKMV